MVGVGTLGWWFVCQRCTYGGSFMLYDLANPGRGNLSKVKSLNARVSKKYGKIGKYSQHKYSTNQTVPLYFNTNLGFLAQIIIFKRTENLKHMAFVFPLVHHSLTVAILAYGLTLHLQHMGKMIFWSQILFGFINLPGNWAGSFLAMSPPG